MLRERLPEVVAPHQQNLPFERSHLLTLVMKDLMVTLSKRQMYSGAVMSPLTQARVLTRLRSVFREAVTDQIIYVNPMDGVGQVKAARPVSGGEALDFDQVARLHTLGTALHAAGLCRQ